MVRLRAMSRSRSFSADLAAWATLAVATLVVFAVGALTLRAAARRAICVPE